MLIIGMYLLREGIKKKKKQPTMLPLGQSDFEGTLKGMDIASLFCLANSDIY